MKKVLIIVGALVGLVVVAMALVPVFVDANKFKPQIVSAVEENLNADVEIGNLKLNVWGGIRIEVERLVVAEKGKRSQPIFSMKDAYLSVAFLPLLSGKIEVVLKVDGPQISLVKDREGRLNAMNLVKKGAPSTESAGKGASSGKSSAAGASAVKADIGIEITEGQLTYFDELTKTKTQLGGLALALYHIGLNQPIQVKFQSAMNLQGIKDLTLKGKGQLDGTLGVHVGAEGFERFVADLRLDASDLLLKYGAFFNKAEKVPLKLEAKLEATPSDLKFEKMHAVVKDLAVDLRGSIKNFDAPTLDLQIQSSNFVLEDWKQVIAMLGDFDAKGALKFDLKIFGTSADPKVSGGLEAKGVGLKLSALTQPLTDLDAVLKFSESSADLTKFGFRIGASDISAKGSVRNFARPNINVSMSSKLFDLDAMLPQKTAQQVEAEKRESQNKKEISDAEIEAATSGPLDALRKNTFLKGLTFKGQAEFKKLVVNKAVLTDMTGEVVFEDLVLTLRQLKAKIFNGGIAAAASVDFKPKDIAYKASGEVLGIDINSAITSQMETLKDTVMGKVQSRFEISGAGVTKGKAKQFLTGKGRFKLESGSWSGLYALKTIGEKLSSIPGLKDKLGGVSVSGKIRKAESDFSIGQGRFNIINLVADLEEANTGLLGNGFVDFDKQMDLRGKILAPGNLHPQFKHSDGRMAIPYHVTGGVMSPSFKSEETINPIAETMGKEEAKKAATAGVQKLKEQVKDENLKKVLEKVDEKAIDNVLKGIKF